MPDRFRVMWRRSSAPIPAESIRVLSFSSQNLSNGKLASKAFDGDPNTIWHSRWSEDLAQPPHELVLDLGANRRVRGIRYLTRQDNGWNGSFGEVELFLSASPDEFQDEPHARRTFDKVKTAQALDLPQAVEARYLRLRILSEVSGGPWASAAEIAVIEAK